MENKKIPVPVKGSAREEIIPALRTILLILGGSLVTSGKIDGHELETGVAAILLLFTYAWGYIDRKIQRSRALEVNATVGVPNQSKLTKETVEKTKEKVALSEGADDHQTTKKV